MMFDGRKRLEELERAAWTHKNELLKVKEALNKLDGAREHDGVTIEHLKENVNRCLASMESLKISSSPSIELAQRVKVLEEDLARLRGFLIEKSPATGKDKPTKTGRTVAGFYNAKP